MSTEEETLGEILRRNVPALDIRVVYTDNTSTMISCRISYCRAWLRLHHMFIHAPRPVLEAIAQYYFRRCRKDVKKRHAQLIDEYIGKHHHLVRNKAKRHLKTRPSLQPEGAVYNLREIFVQINDRHFKGEMDVELTWSKSVNRRLMGSWQEVRRSDKNLITINRLLDDERVPRYYVEYLMFHELLHEALPPTSRYGRQVRHSSDLRRRDRLFPRYKDALQWEEEMFPKLYRSHAARRGWEGRRRAAKIASVRQREKQLELFPPESSTGAPSARTG